jgi:V8-like Glu-specific endopeptidase
MPNFGTAAVCGLFALMAFAGCGAVEDGMGEQTAAIVGGQVDQADPEVFMLDFRSAIGTINMCSSTLVSKRVLLTAGHCLDPKVTPSFLPIRATNKTDAKSAPDSDFIEVVDMIFHPEYDALKSAEGNDLALALLERAPEGVTPKPMNTAPLDDLPGQPVRVLGYGYTIEEDYTSFGIKMEVDLPVVKVDPLQFTIDDDQDTKGICNGDSGGPSFHTFGDGVERIVGVHSHTEVDACLGGVDVRVDAHIDFIGQAIAQLENPDGGVPADANTTDAEISDAGSPDAGEDTNQPDTGEPDTGSSDAGLDPSDTSFPSDVSNQPDASWDSGAAPDDTGPAVPDAAPGAKPDLTQGESDSGGCGCTMVGNEDGT